MEQITIKKTVGAEAPETDSYLPINVSRVEYEYENASGDYIMKESNGRSITAYDGTKYNISKVGDKVSVALTAFKKAKGSRLHKITFYSVDGPAIDFEKLGMGVEHIAGDNWVYLNYYGKKYYYGMLKDFDFGWFRYLLDDLLKYGCINRFGESSYNKILEQDGTSRHTMKYLQLKQTALTKTENAFLALKNNIDTMSCEDVLGVVTNYDNCHITSISVPEYNIWKAIFSKEGMFELLVQNGWVEAWIDLNPTYNGKKPMLYVYIYFEGFLTDSEFSMEVDTINVTPDIINGFAIKSIFDKMDETLYNMGLIEKEVV